ncbi:mucin-binding protein, partial [Streptococcus parasuis]
MDKKNLSKTDQKKWYAPQQRFSIRKYHFGAASVLLGVALALTGGAEASATTTDTSASTTPSSAVETTSSTTDSTMPTSDATTATSTSETTSSSATEEVSTTTTATERVATIEYTVEYQDEFGEVVASTVKSIETKTTDRTAIAIVTETATVPADYELVANELTTSTTGVVEGANTKVVFKVVKKVVADTTSTTTTTSVTDTASTSTSSSTAVAPTTATATASAPKVAVPTTVEEAKVVLEQIVSEAEVLANEGNRIVATDTTTDTGALKAAAVATKLAVTDATSVLQDTVATLDALNTQINAVRTNVEALVLELRRFLGTDVIEISLNNTLSTLQVGEGLGVLVEASTTATPSMDDANGAGIKTHTLRTGVAATSQAGWYTFESYDFYSYNANQPTVYINGTAIPAYIRYSLDSNANTSTILAEVVSTTNGNVLETHTIEQGASVTLTYPQTVNPENETVTITYDTTLENDGSTQGMLVLTAAKDGRVVDYSTIIVPDYQINTTRYVVEDGTVLATYSLQTIAGQPVTPSGQREFAGYTYKTTTKEVVQGGLPAGTVYMPGKVDQSTVHYKAIRKVISNTQTVTEYYFLDPTYTGPVDWNGIDTTGFIKLIETSPLVYTDGKTYDYNKSSTIYAPYTYDEESGYMVFKESYFNEQGSKYRVVAQWSGGTTEGTYGKIFIGTQVYTTAQELGDNEFKWRGVTDKFDNKGYVPFGIQQNLRNATIATAFATTHIYTPVPQEAIIRYQVEGATDFLEDSGTLTGNPGTDITYSTENTINKYKKLGYELVSDNFTTDAGQDYDYDTAVKQEFLVVIKPRVVDVPKGVVPGEPVDPTDPNSPVWPDTVNNLETTQEVTRTVEYKYEDGTPVRVDAAGNVLPKGSTEGTPFVKTETVSFTRPAQVNLVTGEVTYGDWVADTTDTLQGNVLPEVPGYSASRTTLEGAEAPMTETVKDKTVTATDADINEVVYFKENPKYGDVVVNYVNTDGKVIATPVVDTNDALVGTDYSTADRVPEKIVEDETGDVYYYKEVKAEDAAKETGKVVEGTTEVTYVYEKAGNVVVNYITEDGKVIKTPVNDETNAKPDSPYDTTDNKPTEIVTEDGSRYVLIPSKTIGTENGTVEGGKPTEITYVYKKVANWVPQIPGVPEGQEPKVPYPFDPNNPDVPVTPNPGTVIPNVPGYTPVDPKDNTPLKPVDPNDPGKGYVPPTPDETGKDTPIPYVQNGNVVVNYVTEDGTVIKSPVQDETNVPAGKSYDTTDNKPTEIVTEDGSRYVLVPSKTIGT